MGSRVSHTADSVFCLWGPHQQPTFHPCSTLTPLLPLPSKAAPALSRRAPGVAGERRAKVSGGAGFPPMLGAWIAFSDRLTRRSPKHLKPRAVGHSMGTASAIFGRSERGRRRASLKTERASQSIIPPHFSFLERESKKTPAEAGALFRSFPVLL